MKRLLLLALSLLLVAALPSPMASFPVAWVDREEPTAERNARLNDVWDAVRGFPVRERAAVLAIWFGESRLAKYVLLDCVTMPEDATGNCDKGRARSYGQLHRAACPELHELPRGTGSPESVRIAAECTRRHWLFALRRCGGNVEQSFAGYAGRQCDSVTASTALKLRWFKRLGGQ